MTTNLKTPQEPLGGSGGRGGINSNPKNNNSGTIALIVIGLALAAIIYFNLR